LVKACGRRGIEVLTLYAFSTENWRRPAEEVSFLMGLFERSLREEIGNLHRNDVIFRAIGRIGELPGSMQGAIRDGESLTAANSGLTLNVAFNYGGRAELVDAVRTMAREVRAGKLDPEAIDEEQVEQRLSTYGQPDPDLIIRPSGEQRLSNFLLWQSAYAELYLTPVLWPDFTEAELELALGAYRLRKRRFGAV
jgi:undecaprenyl diphosphate synthase